MSAIVIIEAIGAGIGILKNGLDLFNSAKVLFIKKKIIPEGLNLKGTPQQRFKETYETISAGKEMAKKIFIKLCIYYFLYALLFGILLVLTISTLPGGSGNNIIWSIGYGIVCFLTMIVLFPSPVKLNSLNLNSSLFNSISSVLISLEQKVSLSNNTLWNKMTMLRDRNADLFKSFDMLGAYREVLRSFMISRLEKKYLDYYAQLCAMKDAVEAQILLEKIEETRSHFFDVFDHRIESLIIKSLVLLINSGKIKSLTGHVDFTKSHQRNIINDELTKLGLADFIQILEPKFYEENLYEEYKLENEAGLLVILHKYWSPSKH